MIKLLKIFERMRIVQLIRLVFEMMAEYQRIKYRIKCDYERLKIELMIYYNKSIK